MVERPSCLFCGGDASAPNHLQHCDGRQGAIEASMDRPPVLEPLTVGALFDQAAVNAARDEAMDQVASKAIRTAPEFYLEARAFVVRYLEANGPTAGEVLTMACRRAGIVPHDDRAFGPVYLSLLRSHTIERVGTARRERGHGTAGGNVWDLRRKAG